MVCAFLSIVFAIIGFKFRAFAIVACCTMVAAIVEYIIEIVTGDIMGNGFLAISSVILVAAGVVLTICSIIAFTKNAGGGNANVELLFKLLF